MHLALRDGVTGTTSGCAAADTERIVGNLDRGGPIDFAGALGDMVAFHGGRPLTYLA